MKAQHFFNATIAGLESAGLIGRIPSGTLRLIFDAGRACERCDDLWLARLETAMPRGAGRAVRVNGSLPAPEGS